MPPAARDHSPCPGAPRRGLLIQAGLLAAVLALGWWLWSNAQAEHGRAGLQFGFGFLDRAPASRSARASSLHAGRHLPARLTVGLLNTLRVAGIGIALCTVLGIALGLARLSSNPLLRALTGGYIEVIRNTPLVLQLVFWHAVILQMPHVRQALEPLPGVFLSQRGLKVPALVAEPTLYAFLSAAAAGAAGWWVLLRRERARQTATGERRPTVLPGLALLLGLPALALLAGFRPTVEWPELAGFNFQGGLTLSPEFFALLVGLVVYTSAFVAEIVRAGIQSVHKGQWEAARALGLPGGRIMRLVILPAGAARDHPADDLAVPEPDQELLARGRHRLSGPRLGRQHLDQPDRPGDRGDHHLHDRVPGHQPADLGADELVQLPCRAEGALSR
jgi:general L-amino acid transport system permease protein